MTEPTSASYDLLARARTLAIRTLSSDGEEDRDASWQHLRCKIRRDDVGEGALALMFAIAALSFHDARPRGTSGIEYRERDEWTTGDLCLHLRYERGALCLDTDYVRGRMMKTRIRIQPTGVVEIITVNRHQMATRWIELLRGRTHLRLVEGDTGPE